MNRQTPLRILVIGDPHFKDDNRMMTDSLVSEVLKLIQERNSSEETKLDICVILGDTLHKHANVYAPTMCRAVDFLRQLRLLIPVYLLIGNHDLRHNRVFLEGEHPFTAVKEWEPGPFGQDGPEKYPVRVIDVPITDVIMGEQIVFTPYVEPGRLEEALDNIPSPSWKSARVIFAHQEFRDAKMGIKSENGDVWPPDYPLVISGHIHDYDRLAPNVIYVGTPMQHAFGDTSNKTISIFTFSKNPNDGPNGPNGPNDGPNEERVKLNVPQMINLKIPVSDIHRLEEVDPEKYPVGSKIKVTLSGTIGELNDALNLPIVQALIQKGVKVKQDTHPSENYGTAPVQRERNNYIQTLYSMIEREPELTSLCREIFGGSIVVTDTVPTIKID